MLMKSFRLVNSFFSVVVAAFLLDFLSIGLYVPKAFHLVLLACGVPLKVALYSGAFGILAGMAVGREDYCTKQNFADNLKRLGWRYVLGAACVIVVHFALTSFGPWRGLPLPVFQAGADLFFLLWFAWLAVRPLRPRFAWARLISMDWFTALVAYGLLVALTLITFREGVVPVTGIFVALAVSKYLQFLFFVCCVIFFSCGSAGPEWHPSRELILVYPPGRSVFENIFLVQFSDPAVFTVLKALTPVDYNVREFNRRPWQDGFYRANALVAISCVTEDSPYAYQIANGFRKAGAKVVMGGPHVTALPEEALEFCDSVVVGPAEGVWAEVLQDYENNSLKRLYWGSLPADKMEQVDRYLLGCPPDKLQYLLETTRGCKFNCDFCTIGSLGQGIVRRPPEIVAALVERVSQKHKHFSFLDINLNSDPAHMREVLKAIIPFKVKWSAAVSIDVAQDDNMLRLLKDSGCDMLLIGYEIYDGSPESARGGKLAMAGQYLNLTKKLKQMGFRIKAHFMFGFEGDTWQGLFKLWRFALKLYPDILSFSILQPLPGSRFFTQIVEAGRIRNLNWQRYNLGCFVHEHPRIRGALFDRVGGVCRHFLNISASLYGGLYFLLILFVLALFFEIWLFMH